MKTKKWFYDRIGKKVYRDAVSCPCNTCRNGTENGVMMYDEMQADYLFMVQHDMRIEYRDKP